MSQSAVMSPVRLLMELESRSRANAAELPQKREMMEMWNGIAFRIGETSLIAPMDEVVEILHIPAMSRVPNTKSWVLGIANVRGNLLPVMDLPGFLFGRNSAAQKRSRILVVSKLAVFSGLVVDEVYGMRHFERKGFTTDLPKSEPAFAPYVERCYTDKDRQWLVFSTHKLADNPDFLHVGL